MEKSFKYKGHTSDGDDRVCSDLAIQQNPVLQNIAVVEWFVENFEALETRQKGCGLIPQINIEKAFEDMTYCTPWLVEWRLHQQASESMFLLDGNFDDIQKEYVDICKKVVLDKELKGDMNYPYSEEWKGINKTLQPVINKVL